MRDFVIAAIVSGSMIISAAVVAPKSITPPPVPTPIITPAPAPAPATVTEVIPPKKQPITHVISDDPGGIVAAYIAKYWEWNQNEDLVRIEGGCASACTLVLGLIEPSRMCATRNAEFGFHSASYGPTTEYSANGTAALWMFYEFGRIGRILKQHGWDGPSYHPALLIIDAQEIVRPCKWEDYHG